MQFGSCTGDTRKGTHMPSISRHGDQGPRCPEGAIGARRFGPQPGGHRGCILNGGASTSSSRHRPSAEPSRGATPNPADNPGVREALSVDEDRTAYLVASQPMPWRAAPCPGARDGWTAGKRQRGAVALSPGVSGGAGDSAVGDGECTRPAHSTHTHTHTRAPTHTHGHRHTHTHTHK